LRVGQRDHHVHCAGHRDDGADAAGQGRSGPRQLGLFYEPSGLDWIYDYNYEENTVVTNITESLLRLTPQLTIEPALAASFSETDPLKKVYQIRPGVTFHDGSPMTADDVVFSLRRQLNPNSFWNFAYVNVKSIDKTGPAEVTVTMKRPDAVFHPLLATPAGGVGKPPISRRRGSPTARPAPARSARGPSSSRTGPKARPSSSRVTSRTGTLPMRPRWARSTSASSRRNPP
jgi:peptide/nickel transport system substrate-binding protein